VDRAWVGVLEQPTPVGSALRADALDRLGQPRIRSSPAPGKVLGVVPCTDQRGRWRDRARVLG
jgi:hypothetical protein